MTSFLYVVFTVYLFIVMPVNARDLDEIINKGVLRVIYLSNFDSYLPRDGLPANMSSVLIENYASKNNIAIKKIFSKNFSESFKMLNSGIGDVIASNLVVTDKRKLQAEFTAPLFVVDEFLVSSKKKAITLTKDLEGKTIHVFKDSHHEKTANALSEYIKGLKVEYIPFYVDVDTVYDRVVNGMYNYTIQDSNRLDSDLKYRSDIIKSYQVSSQNHVAWAVRKKSSKLLVSLNNFIASTKKKNNQQLQLTSGSEIKFGIMNGLYSYYISKGSLKGFHYDLIKKFISDNQINYKLIIVSSHRKMLKMLRLGQIDIAAGFFDSSDAYDNDIIFSEPFHYSYQVIVTRSTDDSLKTLEDISERFITVSKKSKYERTIKDLLVRYPKIKHLSVPARTSEVNLIRGVEKGVYDITITDSYIYDIERVFMSGIAAPLTLSGKTPHGWLIHSKNQKLINQVNNFIRKYYKGMYFNVIYNKYFKNYKQIQLNKSVNHEYIDRGVLSPYDDIVKKYAKQFGFDWRLMIAQMYQESQFNPKAKSNMGAIGLFQVLKNTAGQLGYHEFISPENNIKSGIHYMSWVREQIKRIGVHEEDIIWFTLASYNAGLGHVRDAIILADKKGWQSDRWFGEVEKAMLLLSKKRYAGKARHGFVRGKETVSYVHAIKERFEAYLSVRMNK